MLDIFATIKLLTNLDDDNKVLLLQQRAEETLRNYLRYDGEEDDISRFSSAIIDLACAINTLQKMEQTHIDTAGVKSESYAEGSVSVRKDYGSLQDMAEAHNKKINSILETLKPYRRGHVVKVVKKHAGTTDKR